MALTDSNLTGFHVSREARDTYGFDDNFFAYRGTAQIPNFQAARSFADEMNRARDIAADPSRIVPPSAVNAVALIQGITQYLFRQYVAGRPGLLQGALDAVNARLGDDNARLTLDQFVSAFPPQPIYHAKMTPYDYILAMDNGRPNREITLEELLMLYLSNQNPAFQLLRELFGDDLLRTATAYPELTQTLQQYFAQVGKSDPGDAQFPAGENILDLLLTPVRLAPNSLDGQLRLLLDTWGGSIDDSVRLRILTVMDSVREDFRFVFNRGGQGPRPFDSVAGRDFQIPTAGQMAAIAADEYTYASDATAAVETEAFTADREWMPNLVLMAKNAYVWLDQLSKQYGQQLMRLDQIPDAELDQLARWGFTGLWLIGLWERSEASKRIKHLSGNPDAVASAYSLWDYQIAGRLGGEEALNDLRARAWKRGIRLASDMVPNHVGIDGKWVFEHPEYFISLDYSPYPNYTFDGPDLSPNPDIGIYIEDGYYNKSDAAVVFKRIDHRSGETRYLYHGNDGTVMPWNDTAQLDYSQGFVRESMIQMIIDIAKRFPVIRFDAAMTLVKRHVHRIWWPEPGSGQKGVASRAQFGMTKAQFDQMMPEEFWREVVDRAAIEAPDTLLLAEAFWLMESYFVRTLGMHRVYNSAFMHILRDEENAKYRQLMRNTLEFDPEILRRYVNFMNNPDEKTAVEQFGKGDKYFGVAVLMMTMPGLPMFGHGQIEGFTEKYGMEYYRAYFDESPDQGLIERHEREIFPLMKRRYLFAGIENFLLYEFETANGNDENVFAYSNRKGGDRSLVVYNNAANNSAGWIRTSVEFSVKVEGSEERKLITRTLGEGLDLTPADDIYVTFRDHRSGLEYIRSSRQIVEEGIYIALAGYEYVCFLDFKVVKDTGHYRQLAQMLNGRGTTALADSLRELMVEPVLAPFRALVNGPLLQRLIAHRSTPHAGTMDALTVELDEFLQAVAAFTGQPLDAETLQSAELAEDMPEHETNDDHPTASAVVTIVPEDEDAPHTLPEDDLAADAPEPAVELTEPTLADAQAADEISAPLTRSERTREKLETTLMLPLQETPKALAPLFDATEDDAALHGGLAIWALLSALGNDPIQARAWIDEWLLGRAIMEALDVEEGTAARTLNAIKLAVARPTLVEGLEAERPADLLTALLADPDARALLGINQFESVTYYDKAGFDELLRWLVLTAQVDAAPDALVSRYATVKAFIAANANAEYQIAKLRAALNEPVKAKLVKG